MVAAFGMSRRSVLFVATIPLFLSSCRTSSSGPPAIADAFAGPSTLSIRQDLTLRSPVVATVKHGERLEVLQTRRRFVQVRTAQGAIGWTDNRQLLSPEQMQEIRSFSESTSNLPTQGSATVYEQLNVHTEPSRVSPSFIQIPENGSVQVIGHKLTPRTTAAPERPVALARRPTRQSKRARDKEKQARRIPPPPTPPAPKPPANWRELSRPTLADFPREDREDSPPGENSAAAKPPVMEDWSLVRTKEGKVGWVLSRMLNMSIPDDVAQYAEGHRITSYFPLADIRDGDQVRHAWLWTTMSHGGQPFEFDGFRVFTWSLRHHRYETVYRGRDVKGFYPVSAAKATEDKNAVATFTLVLDDEGQLVRKTYAFNGYRVNLVKQEPFATQSNVQVAGGPQIAAPAGQHAAAQPWYTRFRERVRTLFH